MTSQYIYFLLAIVLLGVVGCDSQCVAAPSCTACLSQGPHCSWCYKQNVAADTRCDSLENLEALGCAGFISDPKSLFKPLTDNSVRNGDVDEEIAAIQLSPQKVKLELPPGRRAKFNVTFRIAEDYPVDLYYIMDYSASMLDDTANVVRLAGELVSSLRDITKDVRLGFGVFVDKNAMPFVGTRPQSILNPCYPGKTADGALLNCAPVYGFRNRLRLTDNIELFKRRVNETPISGNQDGAEGGFDALLQVMACQNEIGWRNSSRKIVLFSTDDRTHIAGDSKIAGIMEPNDGLCHMDNDEYSYSLKQDYPSIGQLSNVAMKTSSSIIFAVSSFNLEEYRLIADLIPSSTVGVLSNDSSNIVELVKQEYNKLIKTVKLITTGLPDRDGVKVIFYSDCGGRHEMRETSECDGVRIADTIVFRAEVSLESCLQSERRSFVIKPDDLIDSLLVELDAQCECECNDQEDMSVLCSSAGRYTCGSCACSEGYTGEMCECLSNSTSSTLLEQCINPWSRASCSSNGECSTCGSCRCDCLPRQSSVACQRFTGDYCQCNPIACELHNGLPCGGRGECKCDERGVQNYCQCGTGFTGAKCECPLSENSCKADNGTGDVCNGKGVCSCGSCTCTDTCYTGPTCQTQLPECSRTCVSFRECVLCHLNLSPLVDCSEKVCPEVQTVAFLSDVETGCGHSTADNCIYKYSYKYNHLNQTWLITLQEKPDCTRTYWLEMVIGIVAAIFLLGIIALILWKVVVTVYDRKEAARFENEQLKAKWDTADNPLYKPATSKFTNPMYSGKVKRQMSVKSD